MTDIVTVKVSDAVATKVTIADMGMRGRPGIVWRTTWSIANAYYVGDVVNHGNTTYINKKYIGASSTATPDITTLHWDTFAEGGAIGPTGSTGATGATGAAGANGTVTLASLNAHSVTYNTDFASESAVKATTGTFLTADQTKLDGIATSANNYTHPANHSISVITGLQTALDAKLNSTSTIDGGTY